LLGAIPLSIAESYDAIVVGAGGGGLAAAAQLTLDGKKVLLLERNAMVGGLMRDVVMRSEDIDPATGKPIEYRVDATLHLMQAPYDSAPVASMFTLLNKTGIWPDKLELSPVDEVLHVIAGNYTADIPTDIEKAVKQYHEKFGDSEENIRGFINYVIKYMEDIDRASDLLWMNKWRHPFKYISNGMWIDTHAQELQKEEMTAQQLIDKFSLSKELQGHILSPITAGLFDPKDTAALLYAAIIGGWYKAGMAYPVGGSARIAGLLSEYITSNGGTLKLNTEVSKILVEDIAFGRKRAVGVQTADGVEYRAPAVVSNMVITKTLDAAGRENFPKKYVENIDSFKLSPSCFSIFFGIRNASVLDASGLGNHPETMFMDSLDYEAETEKIKSGDVGFMDFYNYGPVDPSVAPAGRTSGSLMLAQYRDWWPADEAANKKKREFFTERMLATVEKHVPGFRDAIDPATIWTRDAYEVESITGTLEGSTLGWYPDTHTQSLSGMPSVDSPIQGLFLAGMFSFPGGGVQAVLMGGIIAAQDIVSGVNMPLGSYTGIV
jgi:phytoene dehydrogenase-like protein